jgi:hypothetical protein
MHVAATFLGKARVPYGFNRPGKHMVICIQGQCEPTDWSTPLLNHFQKVKTEKEKNSCIDAQIKQ